MVHRRLLPHHGRVWPRQAAKKPAAKKREYGRAFDDDQTLDEMKAAALQALAAPKVTCKLIAKRLREAAAKRL